MVLPTPPGPTVLTNRHKHQAFRQGVDNAVAPDYSSSPRQQAVEAGVRLSASTEARCVARRRVCHRYSNKTITAASKHSRRSARLHHGPRQVLSEDH